MCEPVYDSLNREVDRTVQVFPEIPGMPFPTFPTALASLFHEILDEMGELKSEVVALKHQVTALQNRLTRTEQTVRPFEVIGPYKK